MLQKKKLLLILPPKVCEGRKQFPEGFTSICHLGVWVLHLSKSWVFCEQLNVEELTWHP